MPFFRSFVVATSAVSPRARMPARLQGEQFPSGGRENLAAGAAVPAIGRAGPHDKDILDPDAALTG